ncbi:hypothetical protein F441_04666 [Phytophthora nicotianae CJ01A1]|uniref:Reverse transcriptase domain-containing protein n=1 Tax=Phytophthora nicotianae CJ01A1 TaxID=1317063 RepID=W2XHP1_PHYNI|nr:hypothetical protein F441_04666 [Phytophthora nicotianae CJ01A1]
MSSKKTARQPEDESPNLRPYQAPRMDSTNESQVPGTEGYAEPGAMPNQQCQETPPPAASAQAGPAMPAGPPPPPPAPQPGPAAADASGTAQMLASLVHMFSMQQQAMATSQQQMHTFMAQHAQFQHEMYEMQSRANRQKQKANQPKFHGRADDDLELWLFHIEEHFDAMSWYREFKHAMGTNPRTWSLFKQQIRARNRDSDYEFKLLTKMHDLQVSSTQQEYNTKFMQLLSMSSIDMPEVVKRWFYQQNLRPETNSYVSQNYPVTLKDTIEHVQRFEDAQNVPKLKKGTTASANTQNRKSSSQSGKGRSTETGSSNLKTLQNRYRTPEVALWCQLVSNAASRATSRPSVQVRTPNPKKTRMLADSRPAPDPQGPVNCALDDVDLRLQSSQHGHLQQSGSIQGQAASAFVGSGASFNAVCPLFAKRVGLVMKDQPRPLTIRLGGGKQTVIPRRVTTFTFSISNFPDFTTSAFVVDIPESCDVMLGMLWLGDVNPIINWAFKTVHPRSKVQAAVRVGGRRCGQPRRSPRQRAAAKLREYFVHGYQSEVGGYHPVAVTSKAAAAWEVLKDTPVYPLLSEFRDVVFRSELPSVPPTRQDNLDASIVVSDATPVHRKQFPFSKEQREAILKWTQEMLKAKLIRPSSSPYCEWNIVHDFRGLNAKVRVPANPIPRKDEILRAMSRGRLFSALDLLWGFFQVRLREDSIPYTAFATPDELFEYLVTPMGISSSPASFNRLVQSVFKDFDSFCRTYFDDLFVFTPTDSVEVHMIALRKVLTRCAERQLIDPAKATAIRDWPLPKTKKDLQSFIGTCVYVSRFCAGFAEYIALLTEAVRNKRPKDSISLTEQQKQAFAALKTKVSSTPTLAHADFAKDFHVSVDASDFAIGGYIFQYDDTGQERIIAFGGRKLS